MTTAVIEAPETVETPQKPASQIVREWPDEKWYVGIYRSRFGEMCAVGILADARGYDWQEYLRSGGPSKQHGTPVEFVMSQWHMTLDQVDEIQFGNDCYGKEYAADLLEMWEAEGCLG